MDDIIEDFKYEFDLSRIPNHTENKNIPLELINGYICLHQFVKQNLNQLIDNNNISSIIKPLLEKGETLTIKNNSYELKLNSINEDVFNYVKFLLNCSLIQIKNLRFENNLIKWEIYKNNDTYNRK